MNTWITADTHFSHANIIKYCNRPFKQPGDTEIVNGKEEWVSKAIAKQRADEMDDTLSKNWNSRITREDDVFHLGDVCFGFGRAVKELLERLNFRRFFFIWGNHDSAMEELYRKEKNFIYRNNIYFLGDMKMVEIKGQEIVLTHYAMRVWDKSHHGTWNLYGHSHGTLPDDPNARSMDVGVDTNNYFPYSFEEIRERMSKKKFVPIDHHTGVR